MPQHMTIQLVHSAAGRKPDQRQTVRGLGLVRLLQKRTVADTPASRGMVRKVSHLVRILEEDVPAPKGPEGRTKGEPRTTGRGDAA